MFKVSLRRFGDLYNLFLLCRSLEPGVSPAASVQKAMQLFPDADNYTVFPRNGLIPSHIVLVQGNDVLIVSSGVHTVAQGVTIFATASDTIDRRNGWGANAMCLQAASAILHNVSTLIDLRRKNWLLAGHSYGGASLLVAGALLFDSYQPGGIRCFTIGSPRPGDLALATRLTAAEVVRVMNVDDPIPRFAAHIREAPVASYLAGKSIARNWSNYIQPAGGVLLFPDGTQQASELPPLPYPIQDANLILWLTGVNGMLSGGHLSATYLHRLNLASARYDQLHTPIKELSTAEPFHPLTDEEFQQAADVVAAINGLQGGNPMSVFVPVSFRPKVVNVGPNYLVVLHGITLMTCSTRSKARSVAKWLFKFNRVMQDVSEVHTVSWANAWANYFDNASNPLGDFKPLMNVVAD